MTDLVHHHTTTAPPKLKFSQAFTFTVIHPDGGASIPIRLQMLLDSPPESLPFTEIDDTAREVADAWLREPRRSVNQPIYDNVNDDSFRYAGIDY